MTASVPPSDPLSSTAVTARAAAETAAQDAATSAGRAPWRRQIEASGLPAPLMDLVRRVVQRTHLWAGEKSDVAQELIAHFHDGLGAGASAAELQECFGAERAAARLIRRAKVRQRGWWWRGAVWSVRAVEAVLAFYGLAMLWLIWPTPHPSVDYVAQLNQAALATPVEQQGWPLYRQAWVQYGVRDLNLDVLRAWDEDRHVYRKARPGDPGWDHAVAFLQEHAGLLEDLRQAAAKPAFGMVHGPAEVMARDPLTAQAFGLSTTTAPQPVLPRWRKSLDASLSHILTPELPLLYKSSEIMATDLSWALAQNDGARAQRDVTAMLGMARHAGEYVAFFNQGTSAHLLSRANRGVAEGLTQSPQVWSDTQLLLLQREMACAGETLQWEDRAGKAYVLDLIQRIYSDNGHGDGHLTMDGALVYLNAGSISGGSVTEPTQLMMQNHTAFCLVFPVVNQTMPSRRQATQHIEQFWSLAEQWVQLPYWRQLRESCPADEMLRQDRAKFPFYRLAQIDRFLPYGCAADFHYGQNIRAALEATQTAIALELYRRQHRSYPATLAELAPQYLSAVPVDLSTGLPLLYRLRDGKPLLYGRGLDNDDDGGVPPAENIQHPYYWPRVPEGDGDWILYPPLR